MTVSSGAGSVGHRVAEPDAGSPAPAGTANPWVPSSPCDPSCIPPRSPAAAPAERVRRALRVTCRLTAMAVVLGAGLLATVVVPLLTVSTTARIQRRWALTLVAAAGLRLRRSGPACPFGGVLIVANHVSWLDVLALHAVAPVRILAKREVRGWPLIGAMAARVGTVFLDRDRLRALPGAVADLADVLAAGTPVGVFAEGTTRCGRDLGPFRAAAFQAAIDAGAPVQPVALAYRRPGSGDDRAVDHRAVDHRAVDHRAVDHRAAFVGDDTLWSSLWRVISTPRLDLDVTVLPSLAPATVAQDGAGRAGPRRSLAARCAGTVAAALPAAEDAWPVAAHPPPEPAPASVTDLPAASGETIASAGTVAEARALDRVA